MAKPSPKVLQAWVAQHKSVLFDILTGIVRNEEFAKEFAEFRAAARRLTKQQQHAVAGYASEYYVPRADPSPGALTLQQIATLTREAIRSALNRLAHEDRT